MQEWSLRVNGEQRRVTGEGSMPLLWVLRDRLGLTGTKYGCGIGACGVCTVQVDGAPVRSCQFPVSAVGDAAVTTIEGLHPTGRHPVQEAWRELNVPQCGYCQPGQLMTAAALLQQTPHPTAAQIREHMAGVLCRCGTYPRVLKAVALAAEGRES